MQWEMHRVSLEEKVHNERIFSIDFSDINVNKKDQHELLYLLCKRGVQNNLIGDYYEYRQSVNRYTIGALLVTDSVINAVRKELKKFKDGIKVDSDEIGEIIRSEVIKREVLESDAGMEADKQLTKFLKKQEREKAKTKKSVPTPAPEIEVQNQH